MIVVAIHLVGSRAMARVSHSYTLCTYFLLDEIVMAFSEIVVIIIIS